MTVEIKGNKLCIEIDLEKPTPSSSGKTLVVASTRGNAVTTAEVDGKPITIGLNAYIKPWDNDNLIDKEHNLFYVEKRAKLDCPLITGRAYSPFEAYKKINYPRDEAAAIQNLKSDGYGKPLDFKVKKSIKNMSDIIWADENVHEHIPKRPRFLTVKQQEYFG